MGNFAIVHVGSGQHLAEYASDPSALCAVRDTVLTEARPPFRTCASSTTMPTVTPRPWPQVLS